MILQKVASGANRRTIQSHIAGITSEAYAERPHCYAVVARSTTVSRSCKYCVNLMLLVELSKPAVSVVRAPPHWALNYSISPCNQQCAHPPSALSADDDDEIAQIVVRRLPFEGSVEKKHNGVTQPFRLQTWEKVSSKFVITTATSSRYGASVLAVPSGRSHTTVPDYSPRLHFHTTVRASRITVFKMMTTGVVGGPVLSTVPC